MTTFRPLFQTQGPACNCVVSGKCIGWLSCTSYSTAMLIDRGSLGTKRPSGCAVRRMTGDTVGGTTLSQNATVARSLGVEVSVYTGSRVVKPSYAGKQLRLGRPVVLQGGASAMVGTAFQSTNGPVNHAIYLNEGRGWDGDMPAEVLVCDPAADGRRPNIDKGPSWWPWSLVLKFASHLEPNGEGTGRLGPGKWYCMIGPDTEPHVLLRYGGVKTKPWPDRTRTDEPDVRVHSSPSTSDETVVATIRNEGTLFYAYQVTTKGDRYKGSTRWYGNSEGNRWVHTSRLRRQGGST